GETEVPLAEGDRRQHMVDEVRSAFGHAAATAARAEASPLAREGLQAILVAIVAVDAREAATEIAAGEEAPQLPFDEERYALPLIGSGLIEEGTEVARQHLMQHRGLRAAGLVDGRSGTPSEGQRRGRRGSAEL